MSIYYFGHPVSDYNSPLESQLIQIIEATLRVAVENSNKPEHFAGYQRYKQEGKRGMEYYFKEVLPRMDGGVFLPFADGRFGAGVYGEAEFLAKEEKPIWEINREGKIEKLVLDARRALTIEETIERLNKLRSEIKE